MRISERHLLSSFPGKLQPPIALHTVKLDCDLVGSLFDQGVGAPVPACHASSIATHGAFIVEIQSTMVGDPLGPRVALTVGLVQ